MSAIWGCVDLSGEALPDGLCSRMEAPVREYKIDRYDSIQDGNVVMGCGLQYVKRWTKNDTLPVQDDDILFTADCMIDNRSELIAELCPGDSEIPDGTLLLLALKTWGEQATKRIYGYYSYALYYKRANKLILGVSHTAPRALYYMRDGARVYFASTIEPILQGKGGKAKLDEEWLALFIAINTFTILTDPRTTPFYGVKRVVACHYNEYTLGDTKEIEYWRINDVKPLRLKSDAEYREHFRELFFKCVEESIDGALDETGVMLSGGFDSSAVSAVASKIFAKEGKSLFAYTHVPVEGYESKYRANIYKPDERDDVVRFCRMYPNVIPHFMQLPECNGFSRAKEVLHMHETPYKSLINVDWIYKIFECAGKDGCRLMLSGQTGNSTISWGALMEYAIHLIRSGRIIKAFSAANKYCKVRNYSRKLYFLAILKTIFPIAKSDADCLDGTYLNRDTAKKLGIGPRDDRLYPLNIDSRKESYPPFKEIRKKAFYPIAFAHVADAETKNSLMSGVIAKDPTRDPRIFAFCNSIPIECFVNDEPATRRLVRSYLSDLLPPEMLPETTPRGLQSGDWRERIMQNWDIIYPELGRVLRSDQFARFIDRDKIEEKLEELRDGPAPGMSSDITLFGAVYIAGLFLEEREWA